ncbi:short-chain fatty acyl-CoA regulator family protein [Rubellimicrobium mesophilum]|uniref:short-chain fatty acyl-CoA regulator family protein n=1 Tax=Rubellimicrobium mesophilum TaxID=1123067 RepID=UPI003CCBACA2
MPSAGAASSPTPTGWSTPTASTGAARVVLTPIGVSCRLCDRPDCAQRAFPPVGRRLSVDRNRRDEVPYGLPPL